MILKNCEIWHVRLDPKRPDAKFDKENPRWTVQCRTDNPAQKEEWAKAGLTVKLMVHNKGEHEGEPMLNEKGKKQWRINLQRKSKKRNGSDSEPVKVVNGRLDSIDPNTIGNGSIANIRLYQYESKEDKEKLVSMLMSLQVVKHIVYTPKPREEFEMTETEEIYNDEGFEEETSEAPSSPKTPAVKVADADPEDAF